MSTRAVRSDGRDRRLWLLPLHKLSEGERHGTRRERARAAIRVRSHERRGGGSRIRVVARQGESLLRQLRLADFRVPARKHGRHQDPAWDPRHRIREDAPGTYVGVRQGPVGADRRQAAAVPGVGTEVGARAEGISAAVTSNWALQRMIALPRCARAGAHR